MIKAQLAAAPAFAQRLTAHARRMAIAHVANGMLARRDDPRRWRFASLLWPNFREDS